MGTNLTQFKYDLSQCNWLVMAFCRLFDLQLLSFIRCILLFCRAVRGEKTIRFLAFSRILLVPFAIILRCFLKCYLLQQKCGNSALFGFDLFSEVNN